MLFQYSYLCSYRQNFAKVNQPPLFKVGFPVFFFFSSFKLSVESEYCKNLILKLTLKSEVYTYFAFDITKI